MAETEKHDSGTEKLVNGHEEDESTAVISDLWPKVKQVYLDCSKPIDFPTKLVVILCNIFKKSTLNETINIWKNYVKYFEKLGCKVSFSLPFPCEQITCIEEVDENNDTEKLYINCSINKSLFGTNRESYSLLLSNKTQLLARDHLGLHRAIQTLAQIYSNKDLPGTKLQALTIHDSASFCYRALKIDLSLISLKILKKETLHHLIEGISLLKFNLLHLVCSVDPLTGTDSWPMSLSTMEIVELDIFCSQWGISLVPELEASENSKETDLEVLRGIYSRFLQCFSQPKYLSLGPQLTKILTKNKAFPLDIESWTKYIPVTLNQTTLLLNTSENLNLSDKDQMRTILVSNDIPNAQANQIQRNIISINCSSPESIGGCMKNFIPQAKQLLEKAWQESCTLGVIVNLATNNFFLPLSLCLPGIIAIAGFAWNANALIKSSNEENEIERIIGSVLNRIILQDNDEIIGKTILDLSQVEADLAINDTKRKDNANEVSLIHLLLTNPDACEFDRTSALSFQKGIRSICQIQVSLHRSQISCSQSGEILSELLLVGDLMLLACRLGKSLVSAGANPDSTLGCYVINAGISNLPSTARTDIANRLLGLMDQYRAVWLSRYCPNNLPASMLLLQELLNKLVPEDFAKET